MRYAGVLGHRKTQRSKEKSAQVFVCRNNNFTFLLEFVRVIGRNEKNKKKCKHVNKCSLKSKTCKLQASSQILTRMIAKKSETMYFHNPRSYKLRTACSPESISDKFITKQSSQ